MKKYIIIAIAVIGLFAAIMLVSQRSAAPQPANEQNDEAGSISRSGATPITLASRTVTFGDGSEATFRLAEDFDIAVAAEGLGKDRFLARSPDGRFFIADMVNWNLSHQGRILILEDFDQETKRFKKQSTYMSNLRGPNSVAFYIDKGGKSWIYITLTDRLMRYEYRSGDTQPRGEAEVIARFPDKKTAGAIGIVWHITRTVVFHKDILYVSVGSGCNICEQHESELRAVILAMDPDGKNVRTIASGFKNAVGMAFAGDTLYATENGVDHLGPDKPDDVMFKIEAGKSYGWPYCYELGGQKYDEVELTWQRKDVDCAKDVPMSFVSFGPHAAPLGVTYFESGPSYLKGTFLVALHGSHEAKLKKGYSVMRVTADGKQDIFMDGFMAADGTRPARPVHILQLDDNSMLLSDDHGGRVFYLYRSAPASSSAN